MTSPTLGDRGARLFAARLSLGGSVLILLGKFAAYAVTGSTAVLSDALESVVNLVAAVFLLYSVSLAAAPADRNHPYGHGKVEFFSAGVEGTLIVAAAIAIVVEAGRQLWSGPEIGHLDLGLVLIAGLTAINGALGAYLVRVGTKENSAALVADGKHLFTDVFTSIGVLVGLGVVRLTGWVYLDPLVAIAVALHILRTGAGLLRGSVSGLMDEADEGLLSRIVAALERARESSWIDVHTLRAWRSGALCHIDLHLVVPRFYDVERLHEIDEGVHSAAARAAGNADAIVHFDPCRPRHCRSCRLEDCPVRSEPFSAREPLSLDRAIRGDETLDTGKPLPPRT